MGILYYSGTTTSSKCYNLQEVEGYIGDGIDWDFESKKYRYSANSYLEVLDFNIEGCWEPGLVFIQDNVPIYNVCKVR
ncbi:hypothetical protein ACMFMG_006661 [Clarireedia jacksonii]